MIQIIVPLALIAFVAFLVSNARAGQTASPRRSASGYYYSYRSITLRINPIELAAILGGLVGLVTVAWFLFRDLETLDQENLNGHIAQKLARVPVPCTHCHSECTARDKDGNCTSTRHWCDHSEDYDWVLLTDYAEYFPAEGRIYVPRVDSQGVIEPPDWTAAYVGQPVTTLHAYKNLLRGGGDQSVFGFNPNSTLAKEAKERGLVPPRPQSIYQGWSYTPRFLVVENADPGARPATVEWDVQHFANGFFGPQVADNITTEATYNNLLMAANAEAGPKVQANLQIIVCVSVCADTWPDAVMDAWRGGAKNDVDLFIITDTAWKPTWASVRFGLPGEDESEEVGAGNNALLAQELASRIMLEVTDVRDAQKVVDLFLSEALAKFNRKPNKDFAHLEPGLHPTTGQVILINVIGLVWVVGASIKFQMDDPFDAD